MDFITVKNRKFYYKDQPIRLRGLGIGTWLNLEHFMVGLPASDQMIQDAIESQYGSDPKTAFFHRYRSVFFEEADFQLLASCGVNFIRVPFNYRLFLDDNHSDTLKEEGFLLFDRLLALCEKYNIFCMPDLHTTPGSQNPDWHSDNSYGVPLFWEYQVFRRQITKLWKAIADRYKDMPYLMGYDLLNEPAFAKWPMLNEFYEETIEAIRSVDTNHIIVLEGDQFSMDFSGLKHFEDPQLALGFHYYPTVWHPDLLAPDLDRQVRKEKIAAGLDRLLEISKEFNIPAFCGEFGYGRDCGEHDFRMGLLEDTLDLMEDRGTDWLLWCYKDARFMSLVMPEAASAWMKLADEIGGEWSQDIEKKQAQEVLTLAQEKWYPQLTEEERYLLQFRLRACLYVLQKNHILLPKLKDISAGHFIHMADDFLFDHCEIDTAMMETLKSVLL